MKKGIHPKLHNIKVKTTTGEVITMQSTYGKEGDEIILDLDPHNHPAWTGIDRGAMENMSSIAKYRGKFGKMNFLGNIKENNDG